MFSLVAMRFTISRIFSKTGSVSSFCFFSSSLLYSRKTAWRSIICFCHSSMRFCERVLRQDLRLLVDVLALALEIRLLLVELLLAAVEELLQRGLRAEPVLGARDGALDVDDPDLGLRRGDAGPEEERDGDGAGYEGDEGRDQTVASHGGEVPNAAPWVKVRASPACPLAPPAPLRRRPGPAPPGPNENGGLHPTRQCRPTVHGPRRRRPPFIR